jgi:hypothetical protein
MSGCRGKISGRGGRFAPAWRSLLSLVVCLLLAAAAFAGEVMDPRVATFESALDARIAALAAAATREERTEVLHLTRARTHADGYAGVDDVAGLSALGRSLRSVVQARTADAAVLDAAKALVEGFVVVLETPSGLAEDAQEALADPRNVARVERLLAAAEALVTEAGELAETAPATAWTRLLAALRGYARGTALAERLLSAETRLFATAAPPGVEVVTGGNHLLRNGSGETIYPKDVSFTMDVLAADGTRLGTVSGRPGSGNWTTIRRFGMHPDELLELYGIVHVAASAEDPAWAGRRYVGVYRFTIRAGSRTYRFVRALDMPAAL